jgi:hypothetical protein
MKLIIPIPIVTGGTLTSTTAGAGADPAAYAAGTTYPLAQQATSGDLIYQSAQAANTGHTPASNVPTWWVVVGSTNKTAMFDTRVGSQTTNPNTISVVVTPGEAVTTLSLRNLAANSITTTQTDPTDGAVYTEIRDLTEPVGDWWEYLYAPIVSAADALFTGFLPYRNATVTVLIDNTGADAKCGLFVIGQAIEPGGAQFGASDGIDDYSQVQPDAWGVRDIVQRDYTDEAEFNVQVPTAASPFFRRTLAERRAKPTLIVLADNRPDAQYYGLISFRRTFSFPEVDMYAVTVKGFT